MDVIEISGKTFDILENHQEGFQQEEVEGRFSDILNKYDFIVGDWGYGQLRLKGFYDDQNSKATFDTKISTLEDYLYEYCNFGCAYFVLKRIRQ
nr:YutD family protein [Halobacillus kuroshimensis]